MMAERENLHISVSVKDLDEVKKLLSVIVKFIDDNDIFCAEHIYQTDHVIENAYELIEELCDIVGYKECQDDESE